MSQVYQTKFASEEYNKTHSIPKYVLNQMSDFIIKPFEKNNDELRILDAGVGNGTTFLIPLIKKAKKKN